MGAKPKTGPKLFGIHAPTEHTKTVTRWDVGGLRFFVRDIGRSWTFEGLFTFAGGYGSHAGAKRALERHIRREHKALGKVIGL